MIKLRKKQKGFTLVELLIVIAIIAVLAAVVTPVALSAINDSKATAVYAEIKSIETAQLTEYVKNDSYTTDFSLLELNGVSDAGVSSNATYDLTGTTGETLAIEVSDLSGAAATKLDELLSKDPDINGIVTIADLPETIN